nr:hybrid sensor histidine kinase/response regulator [Chroococcidiopsis sp. TS-821]
MLKPNLLLKIPSSKARESGGVTLHRLLVVPFILQIFTVVGLVGYFSLRNGQQAVNYLAYQLMDKVNRLVTQHLDSYLSTPQKINQLNIDAIQLGILDVYDFEKAGHYFWKQMQVYDVSYIGYALATGELVASGRYLDGKGVTIDELSSRTQGKAYTYATDAQGDRTRVLRIYDNYQPLIESWYTSAVKARKPLWSPVYTWNDPAGHLLITASHPIYDRAGRLIGVLGVDFLLTKISHFLRSLDIHPSAKIFIIEQSGDLIASSSAEKPLTLHQGKAQRLQVLQSQDPLIQATAGYLNKEFSSLGAISISQELSFQHNNERHFIHVTPWKDNLGLDWLVVVVVPESAFMAQINENTKITIIFCLLAMLFATLLGTLTSRWITQPIRELSAASKAIAYGDLDQKVEVKGVRELDVLSQSFNRMASQLKESFEQLETRVEKRTAQLNEAKQAAEAANRAKSEFLANMSHELRTPLNAVLGFTTLMNQDVSLTAEQRENLKIINRSGEHLLTLINDVLDMAKIEAGRITLNKKNFDLYSLLNTIEEMFSCKAQLKGLQLQIERTAEVPQYIKSDEIKLRQILINLVGNAIKFTQEGCIFLRVTTIDNQDKTPKNTPKITLHFEVEDTGIGIAAHEIDMLFKPFVQTETGRKSEQGTGLGLAITHKFVQLMEGTITLSSELGKGTIFQFDIPVELAEATSQETETQRVVGLEPGQPKYRILVVDDHLAMRRILKQTLTNVGFEVREAENGQEAIALWNLWEPHFILMDMRMPVVSGYEATQYIKSQPKGQSTIIVAFTASAFEQEQATVLATGCDDFIRKPFREEVIWEKLKQHLGVRYIYENPHAIRETLQGTTPGYALNADNLNVMPTEWIAQLHEAAAKLDAETIAQLITEIPTDYAFLAQALQQKVNNFDFDQIIDLAQPSSL